MLEINSQLDHLESLTHSLEPIDDNEINLNHNRTKLHRFIRIHDDLQILNECLIDINDRSFSNNQIRIINHMKLLFDRLNSLKRIVRIYLEQLEKFLAKNQDLPLFNQSPLRTSNHNLQVMKTEFIVIIISLLFLFSVFINEHLSSLACACFFFCVNK